MDFPDGISSFLSASASFPTQFDHLIRSGKLPERIRRLPERIRRLAERIRPPENAQEVADSMGKSY
jgi:hypothetical protein